MNHPHSTSAVGTWSFRVACRLLLLPLLPQARPFSQQQLNLVPVPSTMRDVRAASSGQIESSPTTVPVVKVLNFPKQPKFAPDTDAILSILNASGQTKSAPVASSSQEVLPRPTISATTTGIS